MQLFLTVRETLRDVTYVEVNLMFVCFFIYSILYKCRMHFGTEEGGTSVTGYFFFFFKQQMRISWKAAKRDWMDLFSLSH